MKRRYFGTDGIRGTVGKGWITPEFVLRLGHAAGRVLAQGNRRGRPAVLIGKDTRISGYMLEAALEAGFASAGVDVVLCGPLPTPAVAYLTRALRLDAGVVISASHNPFQDNGIKFFSSDGRKLPDETEAAIEDALDQALDCAPPERIGRARRLDDAAGRYIEFCKSTFPADTDLKGLKIVVDCANGAAYHVAPAVFHELGADVVAVAASPNGFNINDGCGAVHSDNLAAQVEAHDADYGIALDGDADRLIMAERGGVRFDGDQLLYAIACERQTRMPVPGVVGTLMTNFGVEQAFIRRGMGFVRAKVGDRYVLESLEQQGWQLGGENSGHLICLDKHTTGDGIISALQALAAARRLNTSLRELTADLVMATQCMINVPVKTGFVWTHDAGLVQAVADAERTLGSDGRVLIRPSGTEPVVRVMVESGDANLARTLASALAARLAA